MRPRRPLANEGAPQELTADDGQELGRKVLPIEKAGMLVNQILGNECYATGGLSLLLAIPADEEFDRFLGRECLTQVRCESPTGFASSIDLRRIGVELDSVPLCNDLEATPALSM